MSKQRVGLYNTCVGSCRRTRKATKRSASPAVNLIGQRAFARLVNGTRRTASPTRTKRSASPAINLIGQRALARLANSSRANSKNRR